MFCTVSSFFLASISVGVIVVLFYRGLNKKVNMLSKVLSVETGRLSASIIQTLRSIKYLRATAQMEGAFIKTRRQNALIREASVKIGIFKGLTLASREPIAIAVIGAVLVIEIEYFSSPIAPLLGCRFAA